MKSNHPSHPSRIDASGPAGDPSPFDNDLPDVSTPSGQLRATRDTVVALAQMDDRTIHDIMRYGLERAEALSNSRIAFLHFVNEDQSAIDLQMWSHSTMGSCAVPDRTTHYPIDAAGIWVDCIRERKPVIHNDYASEPHRKGIPKGHVAVVRELTVPVIQNGAIVALLGVGNKDTPYTLDDVDTVQSVADMLWTIVRRRRAETALLESERRLQTLVGNLPGMAYRCRNDRNWTMEYISEGCETLTGYPAPALLGNRDRAYADLIVDADRDRIWSTIQNTLKDRSRFFLEYRIHTADGREKHVWEAGSGVFDADGTLVALEGFIMDISERVRAEQRQKASERHFRHLFDTMDQGVVYQDSDGRIINANPAAARLLGLSLDQLMGRDSMDPRWHAMREDGTPFPGEEHPSMVAMRTGKPVNGVVMGVFHPLRNDYTWIQIDAMPVFLEGRATPDQAYALFTDISEALRQRQEVNRLVTAIGQAGEMFVITDPGGAISYVNTTFERVSGYPAAEVLGKNPRILKSGTMEPAFYRDLWDTITSGKMWTGVFVNRRKNGELYHAESVISPVISEQGEIINYVAAIRDITKERELEDRLRQAGKMEAIGRLAGGVAHDFNNILTVINGYCEILRDMPDADASLRQLVTRIGEAGGRAEALTSQLLAFSRRQNAQPRPINLTGVVRKFAGALTRLIGEDIRVELALADSPPTVMADPHQVEQILMNLMVNARDAIIEKTEPTARKCIAVSVIEQRVDADFAETNPGLEAGDFVVLAVTDSGIGMHPEVRKQVFEPFFTTKRSGKGTGLGLSTVYGIVRQNGAYIDVESHPGEGTTFRIYWPVAGQPSEPVPARPVATALVGGSETILLAEDEAEVRRFAEQALTRLGYTVLAAPDGPTALELFAEHGDRIDLLLTDMVMPGMSGKDLSDRLTEQRPNLPVLFMSGYTDRYLGRDGIVSASVHFLKKPFRLAQLATQLRSILDKPPGNPSGA